MVRTASQRGEARKPQPNYRVIGEVCAQPRSRHDDIFERPAFSPSNLAFWVAQSSPLYILPMIVLATHATLSTLIVRNSPTKSFLGSFRSSPPEHTAGGSRSHFSPMFLIDRPRQDSYASCLRDDLARHQRLKRAAPTKTVFHPHGPFSRALDYSYTCHHNTTLSAQDGGQHI